MTAWLRAPRQLEGWRTCFDCGSRSFCVVTCAGKAECHKQAQTALLLSWTLFLFLDRPPTPNRLVYTIIQKKQDCFFQEPEIELTYKGASVQDGRCSPLSKFKCLDKGGVITYLLVSQNNNQLHLSPRFYIGQGKGHNITSNTGQCHHLYETGPVHLSNLSLAKAAIEQTHNVWFSLRGWGGFRSHTRNSGKLKSQSDSKVNKLKQPFQTSSLFTFTTEICSVLNEAGKLTSVFGFQQARNDEKEADCRPGRKNWLNWTGQMLQGDKVAGRWGAGCGFFPAFIG